MCLDYNVIINGIYGRRNFVCKVEVSVSLRSNNIYPNPVGELSVPDVGVGCLIIEMVPIIVREIRSKFRDSSFVPRKFLIAYHDNCCPGETLIVIILEIYDCFGRTNLQRNCNVASCRTRYGNWEVQVIYSSDNKTRSWESWIMGLDYNVVINGIYGRKNFVCKVEVGVPWLEEKPPNF